MALTAQETAFVRTMILQGNKRYAVRAAFPKLEEGFEDAAYTYMMQNPEVPRHIDAGVLYMFKEIVTHTEVPAPQPLTYKDKRDFLQLIVRGEREVPKYIVTKEGLRIIFVEPSEEEVREAEHMLIALQEAEQKQWMM